MTHGKRLILFVEDSLTQAISAKMMLEKNRRFEVKLAQSSMEALELLQEQPFPDAIITDIIMPEISGLELTSAIRSDELLRDIPILLTTSNSSPEIMLEGLKCGANCFLPKPLTEDLASLLDYVIENSELRKNDNSNAVTMKIGEQIHNITSRKAQLVDMLYTSMLAVEENKRRFEECFQELRDVRNQLKKLQKNILAPSQTEGSKTGEIKILIVDDANINRMICSRLLASLGYDHEVAESAKQVISMIKERYNDFDLIFSDCQMPEMDGFQMTREIRAYEKNNNYQPKPIIALTANVNEEDQNLCYEAGMNDFLSKPFRKEEIDQCIKKWTENK